MGPSTRQDRSVPETIEVGGYQIYGVSVAAMETCICIPSLSLAFDSGKCPPRAVSMQYMAITHGHCDHIHGLPLHLATRALQKLPVPKYFVPPDILVDVKNFVGAVAKLENARFNFDVQAMVPSQSPVELKKGWFLKSFETTHTVPSQGYTVLRKTKKLKARYVGTPGKELARMRQSGVELEEEKVTPEITFTGDTSLDAIAKSEDCRKARILIIEMTFLDESCSIENARKLGHIHIDEIIEQKEIFDGNQHIVFTHFSARYSKEAIRRALMKLPADIRQKSIAFGVGRSSGN